MIPTRQPIPGVGDLLAHLRSFCLPWRALTIAIDGRNGAGKTSVARYLAWQLGMPVLETDLWLSSTSPVTHRIEEIREVMRARHHRDRPVIIEGVMMLRTLELLGVQPDYLIFVTNEALEADPEEDDEDRGGAAVPVRGGRRLPEGAPASEARGLPCDLAGAGGEGRQAGGDGGYRDILTENLVQCATSNPSMNSRYIP